MGKLKSSARIVLKVTKKNKFKSFVGHWLVIQTGEPLSLITILAGKTWLIHHLHILTKYYLINCSVHTLTMHKIFRERVTQQNEGQYSQVRCSYEVHIIVGAL
jgi:hypothetical protein